MSDEENAESLEGPEADAFDELIKHQPVEKDDTAEIATLWEGFEHVWKQFNKGVLVKGILLVESVDERGKVLRWQTSPDMTPWDMMGMFTQAMYDLQADSIGDSIAQSLIGASDDDDDDDDDIEDEQ